MRLVLKLLAGFFLLSAPAAWAQPLETVVQRNAGGNCRDLTISSDGLFLARVPETNAFGSSEIEIWSTKTGQLLRVIKAQTVGGAGNSLLNTITTVRFYRSSSQIITGTFDGDHEIYDVATGKLVRKLPIKTHLGGVFAVNNRSGIMAAVDIMGIVSPGKMVFYDIFSNTVFDSAELKTGAITALEFSPKGDRLAVGTKEGEVHIFNFPGFDSSQLIKNVHDTVITAMQWTDDNYLLISDNKIYTLWNMDSGKMTSNGHLPAGKRIISDPKEDSFYDQEADKISKRTGSGIHQKDFGVYTDRVLGMKMDYSQKRLYVLTEYFVRVWDMENLVQTDCISNGIFFENEQVSSFQFLPELNAAGFLQGNAIVVKPVQSSSDKRYFQTGTINLTSALFRDNGLTAVAANGKLRIWQDSVLINEIRSGRPKEMLLAADEKFGCIIAAAKNDSIASIYHPAAKTMKGIKVKRGGINCAAVDAPGKMVAIGGTNLYLLTDENKPPLRLFDKEKEMVKAYSFGGESSFELPGIYSQLAFSPSGNKLYAASTLMGYLKVWDIPSKKLDTALSLRIDQFSLAPDGKRIFAASGNEVLWINAANFNIEARTAFLASGDYITILPALQYKASANGSKAIAFAKGSQTYSFDQFDLQYNRPDIVTAQLGHPSPQMLATLQKLVYKRWKQQDYSPEKLSTQLAEAPEVNIQNFRKIPGTVAKRRLSFVAECSDKQTPLALCNVLINGVPALVNREGTRLPNDTPGYLQANMNVSVYLDTGINVIEVYCANRKGVESQRTSFEVYYHADSGSIHSTTYFIGIGAAKYQNEAFNLTYPVKDVEDVAHLFEKQSRLNNSRLKVTLLTNEQVTRENVLALKKMLDSTSIDDKVIISWSGHGLLNQSLDYFLATHNTDFTNPEQTAIDYQSVAGLLDGIPARKRVLFLDACHSGELDKSESTLSGGSSGPIAGGAKSSIKKSGLKNTPALLVDYFADLRRNSGCNIISAAGGAEYALESDTWKNGVFTFCLLDALGNEKADLNKDTHVSIRELQNYLQVMVPALTQGRQRPTSRAENLVSDWIIW